MKGRNASKRIKTRTLAHLLRKPGVDTSPLVGQLQKNRGSLSRGDRSEAGLRRSVQGRNHRLRSGDRHAVWRWRRRNCARLRTAGRDGGCQRRSMSPEGTARWVASDPWPAKSHPTLRLPYNDRPAAPPAARTRVPGESLPVDPGKTLGYYRIERPIGQRHGRGLPCTPADTARRPALERPAEEDRLADRRIGR